MIGRDDCFNFYCRSGWLACKIHSDLRTLRSGIQINDCNYRFCDDRSIDNCGIVRVILQPSNITINMGMGRGLFPPLPSLRIYRHVGNYVQISFSCVLAAILPFRIFDNWTIWIFYTILHSKFSIAEIAWYKKKLNENARFRSIILHTTESVAMPATLKIIIIYLLMSKRYLPQHRSNSENRSTID